MTRPLPGPRPRERAPAVYRESRNLRGPLVTSLPAPTHTQALTVLPARYFSSVHRFPLLQLPPGVRAGLTRVGSASPWLFSTERPTRSFQQARRFTSPAVSMAYNKHPVASGSFLLLYLPAQAIAGSFLLPGSPGPPPLHMPVCTEVLACHHHLARVSRACRSQLACHFLMEAFPDRPD